MARRRNGPLATKSTTIQEESSDEQRPSDAPVHADKAGAVPSRTGAARARILVIDDEPLVGKAVGRALDREHEVEVLISPHAALARLRAGERFDIVLCDLMMPEMTGMELFGEVARIDLALASRMVFLTGGAFTPRARAFIAGTKNLVLDKPFDPAQLREAVARALRSFE